MPFFSFSITTPANTAKKDAQKTQIDLCPGVIHLVRIRIPPGSAGLLHCVVNHHLHQIAPSNADEDFHGDNDPIEYREWYELEGQDTQLLVVTWNEDDTYDHEILVQFGVLPAEVLLPYAVATAQQSIVDELKGIWTEILTPGA